MLTKMVKKLVFASVMFTPVFAAAASQVESQPQVLEKALKLEQKGVLKQKGYGHVYLEVSKEFVTELQPLIQASNLVEQPWFTKSKYGLGTHINVMHAGEIPSKSKKQIKELGNTFTFTVKDVRTVQLPCCKCEKTMWILTVDAPELEKLRESYGLTPKCKDREFYIVIGTQGSKNDKDVKPMSEPKPKKEKKEKKPKKDKQDKNEKLEPTA